jgi:hypothetical protein
MIGTASLGFFLALVEFEGQLFSYLDNLKYWIALEKACKKVKKTEETNVVSSPTFA